ncbi:MAG: amidohydrolase family protein, partial [Candidatus Helarchaeales archaeon]
MSSSVLDLKIVDGQVYISGRFIKRDLGIKDGKIVQIKDSGSLGPAEQTLSAKNLHVIPGVIDAHVHFRDLDLKYKEDFLSGSLSAAAGGVTTVLEMPNSKPKTNSVKILNEKKKLARTVGLINLGFYVGLPDDINEIRALLDHGVVGIKIFPGDQVSYFDLKNDDVLKQFF